MPSLREIQRAFTASVVFGDAAALGSLGIVANGLDPAARIGIYRSNVLGNYRKALAATYPVVQRLVGTPFFNAAIDAFVRAYPSTRGDVNRYGAELAPFLATYPPARELPYLPDVARLEWAIDHANIAADASRLDLDALGTVPPEALGGLRLTLDPSARLVVSPYPIWRIWQVNQPGRDRDETVDLGEGGDALLVRRDSEGVVVERLGAGEHALLAAFAARASLSDAAARATEIDSNFDLSQVLRHRVATRTIVAFRAPARRSAKSA
jgi:hypothetical protein